MSDTPISRNFGSIDALLWPDAGPITMHDAKLQKIVIDYLSASARLTLSVCVGNPDSDDVHEREARRTGTLVVEGLLEFSIEPPAADSTYKACGGLWIDAELGDPHDNISPGGVQAEPNDSTTDVRFWIFANDTNSFMRVAGKRLYFV